MVRYADDFVILCRTAEDAQQALAVVQRWTAAAGLRLHPEKTHLVDLQQPGGFDFLGYHFEREPPWPRTKSLRKLKDAVRQKTRRTNGHSLRSSSRTSIASSVGGLSTSNTADGPSLSRSTDGCACALRSILRQRLGNRGRGHPAATISGGRRRFFTAQGLFSLVQAHAAVRQSLAR